MGLRYLRSKMEFQDRNEKYFARCVQALSTASVPAVLALDLFSEQKLPVFMHK